MISSTAYPFLAASNRQAAPYYRQAQAALSCLATWLIIIPSKQFTDPGIGYKIAIIWNAGTNVTSTVPRPPATVFRARKSGIICVLNEAINFHRSWAFYYAYFWGGEKEPSVTFLAVLREDFALRVYKRSSSQVSNVKRYGRKLDQTKIIWTWCPKARVWASGNSFQAQILLLDSPLPTVKSFAPEGNSDSATCDLDHVWENISPWRCSSLLWLQKLQPPRLTPRSGRDPQSPGDAQYADSPFITCRFWCGRGALSHLLTDIMDHAAKIGHVVGIIPSYPLCDCGDADTGSPETCH